MPNLPLLLAGYAESATTPSLSESVLTAKQRAVIRLVSLGCTVAEAAQILRISERTAENHKNRAMDRLGIHKSRC